MSIGYVGLGNMGGPLARRLARTPPLFVFDLNPDAVDRLVAVGATACPSAQALGAVSRIVLTCMPTSEHVREVIFGENGLAAGLAPGSMIIDQTTGDPLATRRMASELAERDIELIDAPVSGGPRGADAGTIAIMVGGTEDQFTRAELVLARISSNVLHAGGLGTGHVIKLANNMLAAAHRLVSLEAVCLAVKNGLDPARAVEIMVKSSGRNHFMEYSMGPHVITGKLAQGFTLGLGHKDVRLATELAAASGVPLLFGNMVREVYQVCINEMGRDAEVNTAALVFDRMSGTQVVPAGHSTT